MDYENDIKLPNALAYISQNRDRYSISIIYDNSILILDRHNEKDFIVLDFINEKIFFTILELNYTRARNKLYANVHVYNNNEDILSQYSRNIGNTEIIDNPEDLPLIVISTKYNLYIQKAIRQRYLLKNIK